MNHSITKEKITRSNMMVNLVAVLLFIVIGLFLLQQGYLIAFVIIAICYAFSMIIYNSLYRHSRVRKAKDVG
ncbi:hypothetical protein ABFG93_05960 [Pseudalkalibacillus hwajinpoensis]|uniref:hypothetical protein n=1 Tax=Guptibacillus hwajinpoensis TaxID=208199 RepID=UPI00325BCEA0